jgi:hypothetical protein
MQNFANLYSFLLQKPIARSSPKDTCALTIPTEFYFVGIKVLTCNGAISTIAALTNVLPQKL